MSTPLERLKASALVDYQWPEGEGPAHVVRAADLAMALDTITAAKREIDTWRYALNRDWKPVMTSLSALTTEDQP